MGPLACTTALPVNLSGLVSEAWDGEGSRSVCARRLYALPIRLGYLTSRACCFLMTHNPDPLPTMADENKAGKQWSSKAVRAGVAGVALPVHPGTQAARLATFLESWRHTLLLLVLFQPRLHRLPTLRLCHCPSAVKGKVVLRLGLDNIHVAAQVVGGDWTAWRWNGWLGGQGRS